jgi:hypothetical protein
MGFRPNEKQLRRCDGENPAKKVSDQVEIKFFSARIVRNNLFRVMPQQKCLSVVQDYSGSLQMTQFG